MQRLTLKSPINRCLTQCTLCHWNEQDIGPTVRHTQGSPRKSFVLRGGCAQRGRSKVGGCITLVIRRLISRGESSLPHLCLHQVPVTCARCHPSLPHPYRPSYLFLPTLALFLFPTLPSVIPGTLTRIPLPVHPSPFTQSTEIHSLRSH